MKSETPKKEMHSIDDKSIYISKPKEVGFSVAMVGWIVAVLVIGAIPVLNLTLIPALALIAMVAFVWAGIKRLGKKPHIHLGHHH